MKTRTLILAITAFAFLGTTAYAQSAEESVKILRTATPGIIKLHYPLEINEPLKVRFITEHGLVSSDRIKGEFPNGLSKKYDVRHIDHREFWVEISSPKVSLIYHITPSRGGKTFTAALERTTYNQQLVRANN